MLTWLKGYIKTAAGIVTAIVLVALLIFGFIKFLNWNDARKNAQRAKEIVSAQAHADTAKTEIVAADTAHAQETILRDSYARLITSPRVRSNPVAVEVAHAGSAALAKSDTEVVHLRNANTQLQRQISDLQAAGPEPVPRAIPYVDPLFSVRTTGKPIINVRAGLDYRIISHINAKVELAYEPPPSGGIKQNPELRLNVGAHITFR